MAEYRVKVRGASTNSQMRPNSTAVANIAELNANIARIEGLVTHEIHRNLPKSVAVASVEMQFMLDATMLDATVTYVATPSVIVELSNFLVSLPRLVLERLPRILSDSGLLKLTNMPGFEVNSAPMDPLPAPEHPAPPPAPPPPPPQVPLVLANGGANVAIDPGLRIAFFILVMCAAILVLVAVLVIIHYGWSRCTNCAPGLNKTTLDMGVAMLTMLF